MSRESANGLVVRWPTCRCLVLRSEMCRWHVGRHVDRSVAGIGFVTIPLRNYKITTFTGICIWSLFELGSSSCLTMAWGNVSWKATTKTRLLNTFRFPNDGDGYTKFSINLLVVYRESVNLIGYITRRRSADSQQLWIANENRSPIYFDQSRSFKI